MTCRLVLCTAYVAESRYSCRGRCTRLLELQPICVGATAYVWWSYSLLLCVLVKYMIGRGYCLLHRSRHGCTRASCVMHAALVLMDACCPRPRVLWVQGRAGRYDHLMLIYYVTLPLLLLAVHVQHVPHHCVMLMYYVPLPLLLLYCWQYMYVQHAPVYCVMHTLLCTA